MYDISNFLPYSIKKVGEYHDTEWKLRVKGFTNDNTRMTKRYSITPFRKDDLVGKDPEYCSISHKEWCDLLYILESKDYRKMIHALIKKTNTIEKVVHKYPNRKDSLRITHKKNNARTGNKPDSEATLKHCSIQ